MTGAQARSPETAMDANFDAELELLEAGHWTVRPHDELDAVPHRESEDDGLAGLLDE